jgi:hypothetical protein
VVDGAPVPATNARKPPASVTRSHTQRHEPHSPAHPRDCGAGQVSPWVAEGNDRALSLYQDLGFRLTGVTQPLAHTPSLLDREMVRDLGGAGTCGDGGSCPTVPAS